MRPGGQFSPEPVGDAEQGLHDKMRKIMHDVNRPAPDRPVSLQVGAIPVARPGRLHQRYLHHREGGTVREVLASQNGASSGSS